MSAWDSRDENEDEQDRILIRQLLTMTPLQRLGTLSNFFRLYQVGQQRRHGEGSAKES
jgi:hypothetical protein